MIDGLKTESHSPTATPHTRHTPHTVGRPGSLLDTHSTLPALFRWAASATLELSLCLPLPFFLSSLLSPSRQGADAKNKKKASKKIKHNTKTQKNSAENVMQAEQIKKFAVLLLAATNTSYSGEVVRGAGRQMERGRASENEKSNFQRLTGECQIRRHANFNKQQFASRSNNRPPPLPLPRLPCNTN